MGSPTNPSLPKIKNLKKKFRPHRIPRYLPGSVQNAVLVEDLVEYNKHLYKVFTAQKKVDDNPPKLDISKQVNRTTLSQDSLRMIQIARENRELLIRINKINKTKGKIDSYNPQAYNCATHWKNHENEMRLIERHNRDLYRRLRKAKSDYSRSDLEAQWKYTLEKLRHTCKYDLVVFQKPPSLDSILKADASISSLEGRIGPRFYCFMDFFVPKCNLRLGRIIIELYFDLTPVTVQNFMSICKGEHGLTYEKCQIHNIVRGQYIETGDITHGNGKGGWSIYGETFAEESHILKHSKMGVLSMIPRPGFQNDSKFSITLAKMQKLDEKRVVFGKVVKGNSTLVAIESLGRKVGKPPMAIIISKCGECKAVL